jgi:hypothetical protein
VSTVLPGPEPRRSALPCCELWAKVSALEHADYINAAITEHLAQPRQGAFQSIEGVRLCHRKGDAGLLICIYMDAHFHWSEVRGIQVQLGRLHLRTNQIGDFTGQFARPSWGTDWRV